MPIFKTELEKRIARKFNQIDNINKNSFALIRKDIEEMRALVEAMKNYLKNQEKQNTYARKEDNKIREEFRKDVDEFTQKTRHLSLALSKINEIEQTLVAKPALAQIEDKIKTAFREQIDSFQEQEKEFKKHINDFNRRLAKIEKQIQAGKINAKKKRRWWQREVGGK